MEDKMIQTKSAFDFDWHSYFEAGKASLKHMLEENDEMFECWTNSDKQYMIVSDISLIEDDFDKREGKITEHFDVHISSNSVKALRSFWINLLSKRPYDSTKQHFIADIKNRKIVEFLSVCM